MEEKKLNFSDFETSKHQYDHSEGDIFKAIGCSDKDLETLRTKMMEAFEKAPNGKVSEGIERAVKIDLPEAWKAAGYMKVGQIALKSQLAELIQAAPDGMPASILKAGLMIALTHGGI